MALQVSDVAVKFADYEALKNISFTLDCGDFLYIIGPNGSGKTTLLKVLTGLISPTSGTYTMLVERYGYLPQKLNTKRKFPMTVEEVIYSGFHHQKFRIMDDEKALIQTWLDKMEISSLLKKPIGLLSGGQQQRVFLIRALISEPSILLLDEPTSALDPQFRSYFNALIEQLHKQGTTIIYVTHDLHGVDEVAKKVLYVDQEIKFFGTMKQYHDSIKGEQEHVGNI